jgi:hypothetical protein
MWGSASHDAGGEGGSLTSSFQSWNPRYSQPNSSRLCGGSLSSQNVSALWLKAMRLDCNHGSLYYVWPSRSFEDWRETNFADFFSFEIKNLG